MANIETINDTKDPVSKIIHWKASKLNPAFKSFTALAPNMVGIARKKENSAAMKREAPIRVAPIIVAPEREVPGIKASTWKIPIPKAVL